MTAVASEQKPKSAIDAYTNRGRLRGKKPLQVWLQELTELGARDVQTEAKLANIHVWQKASFYALLPLLFALPSSFDMFSVWYAPVAAGGFVIGFWLRHRMQLLGKVVMVASGTHLLALAGRYLDLWFYEAALALPVVLPFGYWLWGKSLERDDVRNELRAVVLPLLRLLGEDSSPQNSVWLSLELREEDKRFLLSTEDVPVFDTPDVNGTQVVKRRVSIFRVPWLELDTLLRDGSLLRIQSTDLCKRDVQKKRNRRGKLKTKSKLKITRTITVQLGLPRKKYGVADNSGLLRKITRKRFVLQRTEKLVVRGATGSVPVDGTPGSVHQQTLNVMATALIALYQEASPAK